MLLFGLLLPAIWIGFCILIIRKSDGIAKRLYREDSDASQLSGLVFEEVQILGYNFIGLLLLVQLCPQVVSLLARIAKEGFYPVNLYPLLSDLTQFILGLILFLKPRGLANLWKKYQVMRYRRLAPDIKVEKRDAE